MPPTNAQTVTIEATVNAPVDKVWNYWTAPRHITQWNAASNDWHSPRAENDLKVGGRFNIRMEAKDGSFGFDFEGVYDKVIPNKQIAYTMSDGRKVDTTFTSNGNATKIVTVFDAESENPVDMQREGWQAILNTLKKDTESN